MIFCTRCDAWTALPLEQHDQQECFLLRRVAAAVNQVSKKSESAAFGMIERMPNRLDLRWRHIVEEETTC